MKNLKISEFSQSDIIMILCAVLIAVLMIVIISVLLVIIKKLHMVMDNRAGRSTLDFPDIDRTIAGLEKRKNDEMKDMELVAVITAAIAASEGIPADAFVVRSIKRSNKNKWQKA